MKEDERPAHSQNEVDSERTMKLEGSRNSERLEPGSKGKVIVRSRYQATTSEDTAGWKRLSACSSVF
jgi:hypothetical protein